MRGKDPEIQHELEKNKVRGLMLPDFQTYYIVAVIKTVWYCWKKR